MSKDSVTTNYDPDADVLSWEISPVGTIDYASEMGNIVVHFTEEHKPVFIEILNASHFARENAQVFEAARQQAAT